MKFLHSVRWRMQLWHGLLLVLVLVGFGFTAWRMQRAEQFRRVDRELEQRIAVVADLLRPGAEPRAQGPRLDLSEKGPPADRSAPPGRARLRDEGLISFGGDSGQAFYYVAWLRDGRRAAASANAPTDVERTDRGPGPAVFRLRGTLRECIHFIPSGECVLVGRDIRNELADIARFAWWLVGAGGVVLVLGLAGGGWAASRTLRPIAAISDTAKKIAAGDLSQRIESKDRDSELGVLVRDLNDTFERLQAGYDRQVQFTSDASHELRTPLAVILTQTQSTLTRDRSVAEYRESLLVCQRAAQRMRGLIEGLLALARLESAPAPVLSEPCDLERVVSDAVELVLPLAATQDVRVEWAGGAARCPANGEQLAQVVTNLLSNAIAYNRPGGRVRVSVLTEPGAAILVVTDTGRGIGADDLPHLFERFYRADKARSGANGHSGIGLAISRAIIEAHGGTIAVTSTLGQGSSFTVRLPAG